MAAVALSGKEPRKPGRNQQLVLDALTRSSQPMGAYDLLEQLRDDGIRSPLQVYRALDRLIGEGLVHKIESLSAFAPCPHGGCSAHGLAAFAICTKCGRADEFHDLAFEWALRQLAQGEGFRTSKATVELSGLCQACSHG